ncbi:uncharacterized protein BDW47DRAFT_98951 [Aspergillus candidus]|uniref:Uncharacterized protein n=1 Tax=Aspergillus candidus TaxID=41067 RepID=A0A2I2FN02_ASPCN|nr:hypothetical protein BDW47DRAFT_98951 [Aspergillus candidus]PLB41999.1 hypothetical protein BDW47DRAFT_98951 [Aspergillus candidus]
MIHESRLCHSACRNSATLTVADVAGDSRSSEAQQSVITEGATRINFSPVNIHTVAISMVLKVVMCRVALRLYGVDQADDAWSLVYRPADRAGVNRRYSRKSINSRICHPPIQPTFVFSRLHPREYTTCAACINMCCRAHMESFSHVSPDHRHRLPYFCWFGLSLVGRRTAVDGMLDVQSCSDFARDPQSFSTELGR